MYIGMINISEVLAAIINFIILYLILKHFLFVPVMSTMENRENSIKQNISKAEADREEAEALKLKNEDILKIAKEEGKKITEEHKKRAEIMFKEIVSDANKEAQVIMERSKVEIEREKEKAENEIKSKVIDLAVMLSAKALEKSIDEAEHRRLIEDFLAKVGN